MENIVLLAEKRTELGKSVAKKLRTQGFIPGVYYVKNSEPISFRVSEKSVRPLVYTSETKLVSLKFDDNEVYECVVKDAQFDPITDKVIHIDLMGLTRGEKFELEVPIQIVGSSIGVREGGILQVLMHKLNIECFPKDVPQQVQVDISNLKIGNSIHVRDLKLENIDILNPKDSVIVTVIHQKVEVETTEEEEEEIKEPEVISKGKAEEEEE